ncbi:MAG: Asp/Glu racemase [Pseudomonadota bacterium]
MTGRRGRAHLGLLVPFTNTNLEPDLALMAPPGLVLHTARMGGYDADQIPDAGQMQALGAADLDGPLQLLAGARPDVILYGCTSATLTHGPTFDADLRDRISTFGGAATVTAAGALVEALDALNLRKIGFASPYVSAINDLAVEFLELSGFDIVNRSEVASVLDNEGQGRLQPADVEALGLRADAEEAEAIVLSCTDMRSVEVIETLEAKTGKPVVTSNQAMLFAALSRLGLTEPVAGFGALLAGLRP